MAHVKQTKSVQVSVTPAEYAAIDLAAHLKSKSVDDYLRELIVPQAHTDAGKSLEIVNNLTRERTRRPQPSATDAPFCLPAGLD